MVQPDEGKHGAQEEDVDIVDDLDASDAEGGDVTGGAYPKKLEFGQMKAGDTS